MKKPVGLAVGVWAATLLGSIHAFAADPLSLEDCIQLALKNNLAVEQARNDLKRANAGVLGARSAFYPTLSIGAGWSKSENARPFEQGESFVFSDETWSISENANLTIFDGMRNVASYQQSQNGREASEESLEKSRQDVALETERLYLEVLKQAALLQVNDEAAGHSEGQLNKTRAMKDLGAATLADVYKAEVDFANNRLAVLRSRRDVEVGRASLANYLGLDPRERIDLVAESLDSSQSFDLDAAFDLALQVNPQLGAAEAGMEANRLGVRVAKSSRYPSLSAFASANFNNRELQDFDDKRIEWQAGLRLNFTVFDGFLTKSNIRSAEASLLTARRSVESTELDVLLGVRRAYLDLDIARESITVAEGAVRSSEEDLRLAQERYNIGEGTILDVIDAQVNLTRSKTDLVTARHDARLAVSAMRNAVGDYPLPEAAP
jgi:TolC family type I secretion outer membrane protein